MFVLDLPCNFIEYLVFMCN